MEGTIAGRHAPPFEPLRFSDTASSVSRPINTNIILPMVAFTRAAGVGVPEAEAPDDLVLPEMRVEVLDGDDDSALSDRGFTIPYPRALIVARLDPLHFSRGATWPTQQPDPRWSSSGSCHLMTNS